MSVAQKDLHALRSGEEINDKVINAYLHLIQQRGAEKNTPHVYCYNTFFLTALLLRGYEGVQNWTKKRDITRFDILFFPHFQEQTNHWTLIVADLRKKTILGFDSLYRSQKSVMDKILDYLSAEAWHKKKAVFHQRKWTIQENSGPKQYNRVDCGVFVCMTAEAYAADRRIDFTQTDMKRLRVVMLQELQGNKILPHDAPTPKIKGVAPRKRLPLQRVSRKSSPLLTPRGVPRMSSPSPPRKPRVRKDGTPPPDLIATVDISSASSSSTEEEEAEEEGMTLYYEVENPVIPDDTPTADEIVEDWDIISLHGRDCHGLSSPETPPTTAATAQQPAGAAAALSQLEFKKQSVEEMFPLDNVDPTMEVAPETEIETPLPSTSMEGDHPPSKRRKSRQRKFRNRDGISTTRSYKEDDKD